MQSQSKRTHRRGHRLRNPDPDLPGEEWRPLPGWAAYYEVSSLGRVRSTCDRNRGRRGRVLKGTILPSGYKYIKLSVKPQKRFARLQRLVAMAFLGPPPAPGAQVNHRDGNKLNNASSNLEWVTGPENMAHAARTGLRPVGSGHRNAKLTEADVVAIRAARGERTCGDLARQYGVSASMITHIWVRRSWKHVA